MSMFTAKCDYTSEEIESFAARPSDISTLLVSWDEAVIPILRGHARIPHTPKLSLREIARRTQIPVSTLSAAAKVGTIGELQSSILQYYFGHYSSIDLFPDPDAEMHARWADADMLADYESAPDRQDLRLHMQSRQRAEDEGVDSDFMFTRHNHFFTMLAGVHLNSGIERQHWTAAFGVTDGAAAKWAERQRVPAAYAELVYLSLVVNNPLMLSTGSLSNESYHICRAIQLFQQYRPGEFTDVAHRHACIKHVRRFAARRWILAETICEMSAGDANDYTETFGHPDRTEADDLGDVKLAVSGQAVDRL